MQVELDPETQPATPSQEAVRPTNRIVAVTDARGRQIKVKQPGILQRMRLFEIIGADNAKNELYLGYATLAVHVIEIDGQPETFPATKRQLEGLIEQLDDPGLEAVAKAISEFAAGNDAGARDRIKNG